MSAIPRSVARELNALSRTAHRFHRFAHHPLCDEYSGELVRFGRRGRVCRGCLLTLLGTMTGGAASFGIRLAPAMAAVLVLVSTFWILTTTGLRIGPRYSKVLTRFVPGAALGLVVGTGLRAGLAGLGIIAFALFASTSLVALYRRRGGDRTPCMSCPERNRAVPCRGFAPIVNRERAFQRVAARVLTRAGI